MTHGFIIGYWDDAQRIDTVDFRVTVLLWFSWSLSPGGYGSMVSNEGILCFGLWLDLFLCGYCVSPPTVDFVAWSSCWTEGCSRAPVVASWGSRFRFCESFDRRSKVVYFTEYSWSLSPKLWALFSRFELWSNCSPVLLVEFVSWRVGSNLRSDYTMPWRFDEAKPI